MLATLRLPAPGWGSSLRPEPTCSRHRPSDRAPLSGNRWVSLRYRAPRHHESSVPSGVAVDRTKVGVGGSPTRAHHPRSYRAFRRSTERLGTHLWEKYGEAVGTGTRASALHARSSMV